MKKHIGAISIALATVLILLLYLVTFTVRWQEKVLVLTFGKISRVETDPGLKWIWPWQSKVKFDGRIRTFQTRATQIQTRDQQTVIATVYVNWRIDDPEKFYTRFRPTDVLSPDVDDVLEMAESTISTWVKEATKVFAQYRLGELVTTDRSQFKLAAIEVGQNGSGGMLQGVCEKATSGDGYGVEIVDLGIRQLGVPDNVTTAVFDRMRENRKAAARTAISEGRQLAESIVGQANAQAEMIKAEAAAKAKKIRGQGDAEAAQSYAKFLENPSLAKFLRELETLRTTLSQRTTMVIDGESAPYNMIKRGPEVKAQPGGVGKVVTDTSR